MHIVEIDITDDTSVEEAIETVVETTGRLDVVVNNAGVSYSGPIEAFTIEQVQQQFDTNVFGVWRVNHAAIPYMRKQGNGLLLQIGSIVGRLGLPFLGLYGATKFALEGLTDSYSYELAPFGIDVAIIEPGTYPTEIATKRQVAADSERFGLYESALDAFAKPFYAESRSATPPNPQDIADAVARVIAQPAGKRTIQPSSRVRHNGRLRRQSMTQPPGPRRISSRHSDYHLRLTQKKKTKMEGIGASTCGDLWSSRISSSAFGGVLQ